MSDDLDWLDEDTPEAEETLQAIAASEKTAPTLKQRPVQKRRPAALVRAERALTITQRLYLRYLMESLTVADADRRMKDAGYPYERTTYWRWRSSPKFAEAMGLAMDWKLKCSGISKEKVLLDAEKIKDQALTPKPVLYKGKITGYEEVELGAALRALELQGKGVGLLDREQQGVKVNIDIDFSGRVGDVAIEGESETLSVD